MSTEKFDSTNHSFQNPLTAPLKDKKVSDRVDINVLLARINAEKKKENKINLVFFGLFACVVMVVGIILSL